MKGFFTIEHIVSFVGFPALWMLFIYLIRRTMALEHGVQAMLRDRLRYLYKSYERNGYVDIDDREDWENMYQQYHTLGKNGVMDNIRQKLLALPTEKEGEKK